MLRFTAPSAVQSEFHLLTWFIMVNNSPAELVHRLLKDGLIVAVLSQGYNGNGVFFIITTLIISKKPGKTGISRDIRTEFTTDLLLSD